MVKGGGFQINYSQVHGPVKCSLNGIKRASDQNQINFLSNENIVVIVMRAVFS